MKWAKAEMLFDPKGIVKVHKAGLQESKIRSLNYEPSRYSERQVSLETLQIEEQYMENFQRCNVGTCGRVVHRYQVSVNQMHELTTARQFANSKFRTFKSETSSKATRG